MINAIIIVILVSTDHIVVRIVVGWVVVANFGSQGYWGGDKTYFRGIVKSILYNVYNSDYTNKKFTVGVLNHGMTDFQNFILS